MTEIDDLSERELLLLVAGVSRDLTLDCFNEWADMIKNGQENTPEEKKKWYEIKKYYDLMCSAEKDLDELGKK